MPPLVDVVKGETEIDEVGGRLDALIVGDGIRDVPMVGVERGAFVERDSVQEDPEADRIVDVEA